MDKNTDWKVPAALILAGLALLVALSGRNAFPFASGSDAPTLVIRADNAPPAVMFGMNDSGQTYGATPPATVVPPFKQVPAMPVKPDMQYNSGGMMTFDNGYSSFDSVRSGVRNMFGHWSYIFRFAALALLLFLAYRFFIRRRWNRPAQNTYGQGPWNAPWRGQQQGQWQGQPQAPGQGQGHWEWHGPEQSAPHMQPPPAPPTQPENHGDIMRPEQGNQD